VSLEDATDLRDGVVDAIARYIWEEELSPEDSADCLVFCSVWNKLLRDVGGGTSRVTAMTRSVDIFSFSTWVFFFCKGHHWWIAALSGVQRLHRAFGMTAAGDAAHTGSPTATLAFFNSLGSVSIAGRASSSVIEWLEHECMRRGVVGANAGGLRPGWSLFCFAVTSPDVPQQPNFNDCGLFALSFFRSFFACPAGERSSMLRADGVGTRAWAESFHLLTRAAMRNL